MYSLNSEKKDPSKSLFEKDATGECNMLSDLGNSDTAIQYYMEKPYMGSLADADQVSEMIGSCGDTAKIFLKIDQDKITDIKYQILGCPGAISAAMATVDIVKGKSLDQARTLNDGHVFTQLVDLPAKKHHCIQLAVKALHKAIDEYKNGHSDVKNVGCQSICAAPQGCCKNKTDEFI
jgi:nitrogen fixation NifU-like protein